MSLPWSEILAVFTLRDQILLLFVYSFCQVSYIFFVSCCDKTMYPGSNFMTSFGGPFSEKKNIINCWLHAFSFNSLFSIRILFFAYEVKKRKPKNHWKLLVIALIGKHVLSWVNESQAAVMYSLSQVDPL